MSIAEAQRPQPSPRQHIIRGKLTLSTQWIMTIGLTNR
jgi:hypothetical protein